jgi:hypothetical protein
MERYIQRTLLDASHSKFGVSTMNLLQQTLQQVVAYNDQLYNTDMAASFHGHPRTEASWSG